MRSISKISNYFSKSADLFFGSRSDRCYSFCLMHKKQETILHFVGIGGIGMSGIAEVFLNQGYQVTGSDLAHSDTTRRLGQLGAKIFVGQKAENVAGSHVVVVSSAIRDSNPEVLEAKRLRIP